MIHRIGGPREAATNETSPKNQRLHLRSRFRALEVVDRLRDRGEPNRSSGQIALDPMLVYFAPDSMLVYFALGIRCEVVWR